MSDIADVRRGRLVYSCNCGWIDTGHANAKSYRPHVGAESLWAQISGETGRRSQRGSANGYQVIYRQDMGLNVRGVTVLSLGETRAYYVPYGLRREDKESVALAIFMEVSYAFEDLQGTFPYRLKTGDSSYSEEDLLSDLIGFYKAVRPGIDYVALCKPVSVEASLEVWERYGAVGKNKNREFRPVHHPCRECLGKPSFPASLEQIAPAKKGTLFRDWTVHRNYDDRPIDPNTPFDEVIPGPPRRPY